MAAGDIHHADQSLARTQVASNLTSREIWLVLAGYLPGKPYHVWPSETACLSGYFASLLFVRHNWTALWRPVIISFKGASTSLVLHDQVSSFACLPAGAMASRAGQGVSCFVGVLTTLGLQPWRLKQLLSRPRPQAQKGATPASQLLARYGSQYAPCVEVQSASAEPHNSLPEEGLCQQKAIVT